MFEAAVIGCGQIGTEVMKALVAQRFTKDEIIGTDIDSLAIERLEAEGFRMTNPICMPEAKVYFICVWNTDDVVNILDKLADKEHVKTIFVETTIDPKYINLILNFIHESDLYKKVVFFPHRFNPKDPDHHVFNQTRLFAPASTVAEADAREFLRKVMNEHLLEGCSPEIAILGKVVENAYRAMEIILAQEIKEACVEEGINFTELRNAINTKWNIDVKEAIDGVQGKCLPKDLALFNKFFKTNGLSHIMEMMNNDYIARHK